MAGKSARSKFSLGVTMLLDELLAEESPTADPANAATLVLDGDPAAAGATGRQVRFSDEVEAADSDADADFSLLNLDTTSEMVGAVRAQEARIARMRAELEELRHVSEEVGDMCDGADLDLHTAMGCTEPDVHPGDFARSASSRRLAKLRAEVVQLQKLDERGDVWGALRVGGACADTGCSGEGGFHDGRADSPSELALDAELQDLDQLLAECDAVQASWC